MHLERVGAQVDTDGAPLTVVAARCNVSFEVQPGERIAEKLIAHGVDVPMSCQSGVCSTCITRVLEGLPDHRDQVQTDTEQASDHPVLFALQDAAPGAGHLSPANRRARMK